MFGLFQSVETKGTKAGIAAIQPMLGSLQAMGGPGIPSGMWQDPYIIGYVNMTINMWARLHTNGKAQGPDLGLILMNVYNSVSHQNGLAIVKYGAALTEEKNPEFVRGMEEAMLIFLYGTDQLRKDDHLVFVQAKADAAAVGKPNDKGAISSFILMATWYKEVKRLASDR